MSPVPIRIPPGILREYEITFETMDLDELAELRQVLVHILVRRRLERRRAH